MFDSFRSRPTGERNFSGARAALEARAQRVEADQVFEEFQRGLRAAQAPVDAHNEQTRRYREQTMIDPASADPELEEKFARTELVLEMQAEFNKLDIALSTLGGYGKNPLVVERVKPFAEKAQAGMMKRQQQAMQLAQRPAAPQQYAQAGNVATDAMPEDAETPEHEMVEPQAFEAAEEEVEATPEYQQAITSRPFKDLSDDDLRLMSRRQDLGESEVDALEFEMNARSNDGHEPGSGSGFEGLTNDEIAEAFQSADDETKGRLAQEALWRLQKAQEEEGGEDVMGDEWSNPDRRPDEGRPGNVPVEERDEMGRAVKGKGKTGFEHLGDAELIRESKRQGLPRSQAEAIAEELDRREAGQGKRGR